MNQSELLHHVRYSIEVLPSESIDGAFCYMARHPELSGCMAHGETPEEAMDNLKETKQLYLDTLFEKGQPVPAPDCSTVERIVWRIL